MKFLFILCSFCSFSGILFGQDSITDNFYVSLKPKAGFLAAHRSTMGHLSKERIFGLELSISKRVGGANQWATHYKKPIVGVTLLASSLGNHEILGETYGFYGFIQFPMWRSDKHFLSAKIASGIGYVTKVFDQHLNPKNVGISSHVNALICLGIDGRWQMNPNHALIYGVDLTHLSNGATKVPNLGLNMPNMSFGYSYTFKTERKLGVKPIEITKTAFHKNWKYTALGVLSFKEIYPTNEKKYPVYALSNIFWKQFKPKVAMELSFDVISKQVLFAYKPFVPKTQYSVLQLGVYAGYLLPLDRMRFVLGMGAYVKDRYNMDNRFYHRVGMRYQFDNGLLVSLVLKSHWAKADYIEFGTGYTFHYKRKSK